MTTDATIIADSVNPDGDRLTTFKLRFPRLILAEFNTHRALSRNAASSRAISAHSMINRVGEDPFVPAAWYSEKRGMVPGGEINGYAAMRAYQTWDDARSAMMRYADNLCGLGVHKSYINRLLEPFAFVDVIASATEWANFFALRTAPDAQPEFQALAKLMLAAYRASDPVARNWGEWHVPMADRLVGPSDEVRRKIAVARIARVSYANDGKDTTLNEDIRLYDRLLQNGHLSPFEHVAISRPQELDFEGNFFGWTQLRHIVGRDRTWDDVPEA